MTVSAGFHVKSVPTSLVDLVVFYILVSAWLYLSIEILYLEIHVQYQIMKL